MKNYNFDIKVEGLNGETLKEPSGEELTYAKMLSNFLHSLQLDKEGKPFTIGNTMKIYAMGEELKNKKEISLSKEDVKFLSELIANLSTWNIAFKFKIFTILEVE